MSEKIIEMLIEKPKSILIIIAFLVLTNVANLVMNTVKSGIVTTEDLKPIITALEAKPSVDQVITEFNRRDLIIYNKIDAVDQKHTATELNIERRVDKIEDKVFK